MNKTDFDNKLISFNRKITSNETKIFRNSKNANSLVTKDYNFSLSEIYFTINDGYQSTCVYQLTLDT